jgi:hypothetical protein
MASMTGECRIRVNGRVVSKTFRSLHHWHAFLSLFDHIKFMLTWATTLEKLTLWNSQKMKEGYTIMVSMMNIITNITNR